MAIHLCDNDLCAEDFVRLRAAAGFSIQPLDQVNKALQNSLLCVTAHENDQVVGMGRLVGDGVMYWYIQDVMVDPERQGIGVGTMLVQRMLQFAEENSLPGTRITIGLMAAKGKDGFYEKLGFDVRPNDRSGSGMTKLLVVPER